MGETGADAGRGLAVEVAGGCCHCEFRLFMTASFLPPMYCHCFTPTLLPQPRSPSNWGLSKVEMSRGEPTTEIFRLCLLAYGSSISQSNQFLAQSASGAQYRFTSDSINETYFHPKELLSNSYHSHLPLSALPGGRCRPWQCFSQPASL